MKTIAALLNFAILVNILGYFASRAVAETDVSQVCKFEQVELDYGYGVTREETRIVCRG